jgi:hypothetical protein
VREAGVCGRVGAQSLPELAPFLPRLLRVSPRRRREQRAAAQVRERRARGHRADAHARTHARGAHAGARIGGGRLGVCVFAGGLRLGLRGGGLDGLAALTALRARGAAAAAPRGAGARARDRGDARRGSRESRVHRRGHQRVPLSGWAHRRRVRIAPVPRRGRRGERHEGGDASHGPPTVGGEPRAGRSAMCWSRSCARICGLRCRNRSKTTTCQLSGLPPFSNLSSFGSKTRRRKPDSSLGTLVYPPTWKARVGGYLGAHPEAPVRRRRATHRLARYFDRRDRADPRGDARVTWSEARASDGRSSGGEA